MSENPEPVTAASLPPRSTWPERIKTLPIDRRGFPVPWFVTWLKNGERCLPGEGEPDFRVADTDKLMRAVRQRLCWICGGILGRRFAFVIGPMCAVNRTSSEPPSHRTCAEFAAKACPFMLNPRMRRNEKDLPTGHQEPGGEMIKRNPGVTLIWMTQSYRPFKVENGLLFQIGDPDEVLFMRNGMPASRHAIIESIQSGLPILRKIAKEEGTKASLELERHIARAYALLPKE